MFTQLWKRCASSVRALLAAPTSTKARQRRRYRPALEHLEGRCTPAVVAWDGGGDGQSWLDPLNWSGDALPGPADDTWLDASFISHSGGSTSVRSLHGSAVVDFTGSLTLAAPSSLDGQIDLTGALALQDGASLVLGGGNRLDGAVTLGAGSALSFSFGPSALAVGTTVSGPGTLYVLEGAELSMEGAAVVENLVLEVATIAGSGDLTITGHFTWYGGTLTGAGALNIAAGATLTITDTYDHTLDRAVNNAGTATLENGGGVTATGVTFTNAAGGVFEAQGAVAWYDSSGISAFTNEGTFRKTGAGTAAFEVAFNSSGSVEVDADTLALEQGGTLQGAAQAAAGATIGFNSGTFNLLSGFYLTGDGFAVFGNNPNGQPSGLVFGTVALNNVDLRNGTLDGPGTLTINQRLIWAGGTMSGTGTTVLQGSAETTFGPAGVIIQRTVINNGVMNFQPGSLLVLAAGARLINAGRLNLQASAPAPSVIGSLDGANDQLENNGEMVVSGAGLLRLNPRFLVNGATGSITVGSGTLDIAPFNPMNATGRFTNYGYLEAAASAVVRFVGAGLTHQAPVQLFAEPCFCQSATLMILSGTEPF